MVHKRTDFNQITDQIFIGTNFCCMEHFDERLLKLGVTTNISLEAIKTDSPFGVKAYAWLPVEDHFSLTEYQFRVGTAVLEKAIENGEKIYVHCQNGHGRAPALVAAYFMKSKKIGPEEAVQKIKEKRPEIHLEETQWEGLRRFANNP